MYEYLAKVIRVIDGDTVECLVDLGFSVHTRATLRLDSIDAPELSTPEGKRAREYLAGMLPPDVRITTRKDKREKYGRMMATVWLPDGTSANRRMLDALIARPYDGGSR